MRQFARSIDIQAPPERVYTVIADVERWHEWTASVRRIKLLGGGAFAVGSLAFVRQPGLPPAFWKATRVEPGRGFTWASVAPGVRVLAHHDVVPTATGARATLSLDFQGPLGGWMGRLLRSVTERYLVMEANGLKARSENPSYRVAR